MVKPVAAATPKTGTAPLAAVKPAAAAPVKVAPAVKAKKSRKMLWIALAVLLLAVTGGLGWYFLADAPAESKPAARAPLFMNLEPFTVNLAEESGDHYLQLGVVYQLADDKAAESMKLYMPVVRNHILLLLSAKKPSDLSSSEGKQKLVEELVVAARQSLPGEAKGKGIVGALLSAIVIQ